MCSSGSGKGFPGKGRIFSAGIYARLSVAGSSRKQESIETQIEMAEAFIREQDDIMLRGCYTDLGKSGMDFNREGFERMMQDVYRGSIDCIVVKDLSRFGRNQSKPEIISKRYFRFSESA